ncbi:MAG: DUF4398 domain-containing protein [Myxococcota bacterium]
MKRPPSTLLPLVLALLGGCAAAKVQLQIVQAEEALGRAEHEEAPRKATYEYTMAAQYLDKAREEAGFSSYRIADQLARRSAQWSDRAIIAVERKGRGELDLDVLPDALPPEEAEAPPPAPAPDDDLDDLDDDIDIPVAP